MKGLMAAAILFISSMGLVAQERVSMSSPIIRSTTEEVTVTAEFTQFNREGEYRIGVGTAGGPVPGAKIELLRNDAPVTKVESRFEQGYTANWWDVNAIKATGFTFAAGEAPASGPLTVRIAVPRSEIEKIDRFFLFVAKKYGPDLWYLEDGTEITDKYW